MFMYEKSDGSAKRRYSSLDVNITIDRCRRHFRPSTAAAITTNIVSHPAPMYHRLSTPNTICPNIHNVH